VVDFSIIKENIIPFAKLFISYEKDISPFCLDISAIFSTPLSMFRIYIAVAFVLYETFENSTRLIE